MDSDINIEELVITSLRKFAGEEAKDGSVVLGLPVISSETEIGAILPGFNGGHNIYLASVVLNELDIKASDAVRVMASEKVFSKVSDIVNFAHDIRAAVSNSVPEGGAQGSRVPLASMAA